MSASTSTPKTQGDISGGKTIGVDTTSTSHLAPLSFSSNTMVKVAVAGGTSNIGRHIAEEILATKKHTVVVLSRSPGHRELEALGAQIAAVDYADPSSLAAALAGVHTVISVLSIFDPAPQLALLDASVKAGVTRFAPSEWAARSIPNNPIEWYNVKWDVAEAVRRSGLEYTIFENGVFMNYLAGGTPGLGHLKPVEFIWNVEKCTAQIPGDGSTGLVFTRAEDVGKFVAASLDLNKWPEYSQMRGDRKTLNEVVKLAEETKGEFLCIIYSETQLILVPQANLSKSSIFLRQSLRKLSRTKVPLPGLGSARNAISTS